MTDLHVHTRFSDGADAPEEIVRAAIARGMETVGFSDHSPLPFPCDWCMTGEGAEAYRAEVTALKEKYRGRIRILLGVEQDFFSVTPTDGYDYVIGSVHFLSAGGRLWPVDEDEATFCRIAREVFSDDFDAMAEAYFSLVAGVAEKTNADVIGHFDLISKFNEGEKLFSESSPRYRAAWQAAADRLLASGKPFEINTGAMHRGYRTAPYPSAEIRAYLRARGARFLLSSDSHSAQTLCCRFEDYAPETR